MEDTLEMHFEGYDEGSKKEKSCPTDADIASNTSTIAISKQTPKRMPIVYDLSDHEKDNQHLKSKLSSKIKSRRSVRSKKDSSGRIDHFKRGDVNGATQRRKVREKKQPLGISTDLRENIKIKQRHGQTSSIESQVKIEYIHEPEINNKSDELHSGNGYVKEELKRDILNLKSKLEGVEAKVNNNYYPAKTVTKIECHSNYKLHMEKEEKVKSNSYASKRRKHYRTETKRDEETRRRGDRDAPRKYDSVKMDRNRKRLPLAEDKHQRLRDPHHMAKISQTTSVTGDGYRVRPSLRNRSEKRRDVLNSRRDGHSVRSRFPSGILSKLRSKRLEDEASKVQYDKEKRNKSLSPTRVKGVRNKEQKSTKRPGHRHSSRGSDPGQPSKTKLLPWPQFKPAAENSISFANDLTLRQDAFGLHPDINPKMSKFTRGVNLSRDDPRSTTPVYDFKTFDLTPVLVQSPLLPNQREDGRFLSQNKKPSGDKGIDWKVANNLADDKMLRYIQHCSVDYAKELDKTFPDLRRVLNYLVKSDVPKQGLARDKCGSGRSNRLLPCDIFNQSDKCPYTLLHLDSKQDQRIHSCSLCYFTLGGLINMHRQTRCPLLNIIRN